MILPETAATRAARRRRPRPRRAHRRQGPRPRRPAAAELRARLRPRRPRHRPLRGDAGPPDRRRDRPLRPPGREPAGLGARRQGGLEGRAAARPRHPHDGLAAARPRRSTASSAARSSTRWATTWSRSAWSSGSTTATSSCPSHDLLQELKTHRLIRKILDGGERIGWGAKTIPEGGFLSLPKRLNAPGPADLRRRRRARQRAGAEGDPLRDRVRPARRRGRVRRARARRGRRAPGRARRLRRRAPRELRLERPARGAEHAPGVRPRLLDRRRARRAR